MADANLPLLHKYVFKDKDNLQLRMTKLKYRLCVQEVASIIHGRHQTDFSDIEPSIEADYTMATSVEACPPRMEDFATVSNDEGLSSPGSDEYPQKSSNQDNIYNDSGIIFDDSSANNTTQIEANGLVDDDRSDVSDTDPNVYHISRDDEPKANGYGEDRLAEDHDDSAVVVANGDSTLENGDDAPVVEEVIEPKRITRESVRVNFADADAAEYDASPPTTPTELADAAPVVVVTDAEKPADEVEEEEVEEELITKSEAKRDDEYVPETEDERVDFVPGITCEDVETALQILKTHYRLGSSTLKKSIITSPDSKNKRYSAPVFSYERSKWNLQDLVRSPGDYPSWKVEDKKTTDEDDIAALTDTINRKDEELSKLLQKVLDEERKKNEEKQQQKTPPEPEITELKEEPTQQEAPPSKPGDENEDQPSKKKKRNIFQRMMRALRKRFSTHHHRSQ